MAQLAHTERRIGPFESTISFPFVRSVATAEKGMEIYTAAVEGLTKVIQDLKDRPFRKIEDKHGAQSD